MPPQSIPSSALTSASEIQPSSFAMGVPGSILAIAEARHLADLFRPRRHGPV